MSITGVDVTLEVRDDGVRVEATARVTGQTGVEMEALTAAAVAGLTLIDMVKALEKGVTIEQVRLLAKSGGRSGEWNREDEAPQPRPNQPLTPPRTRKLPR